MNNVQILGTGRKFIGKGVRGTQPVIEDIIQKARKEIQVAAYVFTKSADRMLTLLENAAERGLRVTVVVDHMDKHQEPVLSRLKNLSKHGEHVRVVNFNDPNSLLHAKVVVADRTRAVVGSANFTMGGMDTNYEIGILLEGEKVDALAELIDALSDN